MAHRAVAGREHKNLLFNEKFATMVPKTSGVYMVCTSPDSPQTADIFSELKCPLYIGQTTNLRARFLQHLQSSSPVHSITMCFKRVEFRFVEVPTDDLNGVELALYKAFGPPTNRQSPPLKGSFGPAVPANP